MPSVARKGARTDIDLAALIPGIYSEGEAFHISPSGAEVAFAYRENHEGNTIIALQTLGRAKRIFQVEPGVHVQLAFTPDGDHLMFTFSGPRHPADMWMLDVREGKFRQLTHSLPASIDRRTFVEPTVVRFESMDGLEIPAFLYKPRKADPRPPAIVYLHGGPMAQHKNDWYPDGQDLGRRTASLWDETI
jgi:dipeptidyl aminopeptidase/acylaminoacyl peptidase